MVCVEDSPGDGESKADAVCPIRNERLENGKQMFRCDSAAVILYLDYCACPVGGQTKLNSAVGADCFECILDQIDNGSADVFCVEIQAGTVGCAGECQ